jgi:hypothetical protein
MEEANAVACSASEGRRYAVSLAAGTAVGLVTPSSFDAPVHDGYSLDPPCRLRGQFHRRLKRNPKKAEVLRS